MGNLFYFSLKTHRDTITENPDNPEAKGRKSSESPILDYTDFGSLAVYCAHVSHGAWTVGRYPKIITGKLFVQYLEYPVSGHWYSKKRFEIQGFGQ